MRAETLKPFVGVCLCHCSVAVKRNHDQGTSKRKHVIGDLPAESHGPHDTKEQASQHAGMALEQ